MCYWRVFLYFQNLYDLDDDDDVIAPIPTKQMKFAASGSFLHHMVCDLTFFLSSVSLIRCIGDVVESRIFQFRNISLFGS